MNIMLETEILIVGSGAIGSRMAAELAEAGRHVTILEAGGPRSLDKLYSSTIWGRRIHDTPRTSLDGNDPLHSLSFNIGTQRGGTALHHYAIWLRMMPDDFKVASLYGKGLDWPIEYSDLQPYYDKVQDEVGISGDASVETWRPRVPPTRCHHSRSSDKAKSSPPASRNPAGRRHLCRGPSIRSNTKVAPPAFRTAGATPVARQARLPTRWRCMMRACPGPK